MISRLCPWGSFQGWEGKWNAYSKDRRGMRISNCWGPAHRAAAGHNFLMSYPHKPPPHISQASPLTRMLAGLHLPVSTSLTGEMQCWGIDCPLSLIPPTLPTAFSPWRELEYKHSSSFPSRREDSEVYILHWLPRFSQQHYSSHWDPCLRLCSGGNPISDIHILLEWTKSSIFIFRILFYTLSLGTTSYVWILPSRVDTVKSKVFYWTNV